jgi:hypothetical protein
MMDGRLNRELSVNNSNFWTPVWNYDHSLPLIRWKSPYWSCSVPTRKEPDISGPKARNPHKSVEPLICHALYLKMCRVCIRSGSILSCAPEKCSDQDELAGDPCGSAAQVTWSDTLCSIYSPGICWSLSKVHKYLVNKLTRNWISFCLLGEAGGIIFSKVPNATFMMSSVLARFHSHWLCGKFRTIWP